MPVLLEKSELYVSLALKNGNDTAKSTIKHMGPNNVHVGLGFRMDPSGTQKTEIDFRKKQSNSLSSRLGTSHLNPTEAWVLYSSAYIPKVYFPCKISSFSENEWAYVTARATHTLLAKMSYNRNTSFIAVYRPRRLGGIGLTHGYARQGAESACHLLTHVRWGGDLGTVMTSMLSQVQLLSGRGVSILQNPIQRPKRNAKNKAHIYKWHHIGIGRFQ